MPAVIVIAVLAIAAIAGAKAVDVADSNAGSRPAAPIQAFLLWVVWFFPLTVVGTFLTLLAYLVVPPRARAALGSRRSC